MKIKGNEIDFERWSTNVFKALLTPFIIKHKNSTVSE